MKHIGYIVREATTDYFYFAVNPADADSIEVGGIVKVEKNGKKSFAIIEDIHSISIEEEKMMDYDAIEYVYGQVKKPEYIIQAKAVFIDRVSIPPSPGDKVYLPSLEEIKELYTESSRLRILVGKLRTYVGEIDIYAKIKELIIRHTGIFGITGSGKSTTVAHLVKELLEKNIPLMLFDVHRDYVLSYDNSIIITFDEKEKKKIEELLLENGLKSKVYVAKLEMETLKEMMEEVLGISDKNAPHVYRLLIKILSTNPKTIRELLDALEGHKTANEDLNRIVRQYMQKRSASLESLKARISRLEGWRVFRRDMNDSGEEMKRLLDEILEMIKKGISSEIADIELSEDGEITFTKEEKKLGAIIFDLYVLSLEEQKILIDFVLDYLLKKYKEWKFAGNPDILSVIIEEAHRFASKDTNVAEKLSTIAREGRKFGIGMFLITQIPSKIREDIISQINNFFFLKIINPKDLEFIKKSCPYLSKEYFEALTRLETGRCLLVGLAFRNPAIVSLIRDVKIGGTEEDIERRLIERTGLQ